MRIDYRKALTGAFVLGVLLFVFKTIKINLMVINLMFNKEIPIGTILLLIFGIIILDHLRRLFRFYQVSAKNRDVVGIVSSACIYLIILSIALSIQYDISGYLTPSQKEYIDMDYEQFMKALYPPVGSTELQKQDYYNSLNRFNGKYVKWRLKIDDVTKDSIILSGYNLVTVFIAENQKSELISLKKGDYITVEGIPDYKETFSNNAQIWVHMKNQIKLYDGRIISKG